MIDILILIYLILFVYKYHMGIFSYIEPPNERIRIVTVLLKVLCVCTIIMGIFRLPSQKF